MAKENWLDAGPEIVPTRERQPNRGKPHWTKVSDHHYVICGLGLKDNEEYQGPWDTCYVTHSEDVHLYFANGKGGNGLGVGALLKVVVDRMEQTEPNSEALVHARAALAGLVG